MAHILIVEDDLDIGNLLEEALTNEGYQITRAYSGTEAQLLASNKYDLVLLDLMLPGLAGEEVLKKFNTTKVIIMSAKMDIDNKVKLLLDGAVDYITKPFYLKEVVARVKVALRIANPKSNILSYKELKMNKDTHEFWVNLEEVKLTKTEFAIMQIFLENPERVYTKANIVDLIYDYTSDGSESSLNAHISNIRNKISKYAKEEYIEAIWGLGYKLQK